MPPVHKRLHIHLDTTGKDDAGGNLGLGVVLVAHRLEDVVYDTKGRYGAREHSGHSFFWPRG